MARWRPDPRKVGDQEPIGRRVYGDKIYDRSKRLRIDHFQDSRLENDLSVDRLGRANPERAVVRYIGPKAEEANPGKPFAGWAALRVNSIRNGRYPLEVLASPNDDNEYHADICRDGFREDMYQYYLAIRLREIVESDLGFVEAPS